MNQENFEKWFTEQLISTRSRGRTLLINDFFYSYSENVEFLLHFGLRKLTIFQSIEEWALFSTAFVQSERDISFSPQFPTITPNKNWTRPCVTLVMFCLHVIINVNKNNSWFFCLYFLDYMSRKSIVLNSWEIGHSTRMSSSTRLWLVPETLILVNDQFLFLLSQNQLSKIFIPKTFLEVHLQFILAPISFSKMDALNVV